MKVYFLNDIIEGGAILDYTNKIIEALYKLFESSENVLLNPNSKNVETIRKKNIPFKDLIKKILNFHIQKRKKKEVEKIIFKLKNLSNKTLFVLPYIIQNDKGILDRYYSEISKMTFILVIHDLHAFHFPESHDKLDLRNIYFRYNDLAKNAKLIIVHNQFTKNDVIDKLGINAQKIQVIHLPPFQNYKSNLQIPLPSFALKNEYAIWASSSTSYHKNHENLFYAWKKLIEDGYKLKLICTGSKNPRWDEISNLIQELGLSEYVHFTGLIKREEVSKLIENAKLSICPTLFEGGGPEPAMESIIYETPLALSNIPQCLELVSNNQSNAYFFNPYDHLDMKNAVVNILNNYTEAKVKAKNTKNLYEKERSWEKSANAYFQIITSIC
jgi:glycosyltransferase involved in cell wall biosynthesis